MKYITTMILAATFSLSFLSCQSTGSNDKLLAVLAKAGVAYAEASGKITPENKVYIDLAYQTIITGKIDQQRLVALAKEAAAKQLGKDLSESDRAAILGVLAQIESGGLNRDAIVPLAKAAITAYAASHGVPPEQVAALTALAEALTA